MNRSASSSVEEDQLSLVYPSARYVFGILGKLGAIALTLAIILGMEGGPSEQVHSSRAHQLHLRKVEETDNHYQLLADHRQSSSRLHIEVVAPGGNDKAQLVYTGENLGHASLSIGRSLRVGVSHLSSHDQSANIRTPVAKTSVTNYPDGSVRIVIDKETGDHGTVGDIWLSPEGKVLPISKLEESGWSRQH